MSGTQSLPLLEDGSILVLQTIFLFIYSNRFPVQVPYLVDHNTGVAMGESEEIVKYLFDTYSVEGGAAA